MNNFWFFDQLGMLHAPSMTTRVTIDATEHHEVVDVEYTEVSSTLGTGDAPALDAILVTRSRKFDNPLE